MIKRLLINIVLCYNFTEDDKMKKIVNKIKNNNMLYTISIYIILFLFMLVIKNISLIIKSMQLSDISNISIFMKDLIKEIIYFLLFIPILFLFKKQKIYTEKRISFVNTLKLSWPILLVTIIDIINNINLGIKGHIKYELIDIVVLFLFCMFIGLFEETMFKGWLFNSIYNKFKKNEKNVLKIIILCSFTFGLLHLINYDGGNFTDVVLQASINFLMDIGILMVYYKSRNIYVPIFYHTMYDFRSFLESDINATSASLNTNIIFVLIGLIFLSFPYILNAILIYSKNAKIKKILKVLLIIYFIILLGSEIMNFIF